MSTKELRNQSIVELKQERIALLKEQFNLRMLKGSGQEPRSHLFKNVRRNIARIETMLCEKAQES